MNKSKAKHVPSSVQRQETFQKILTLPGNCQEDGAVLKLLAWFPVDRPNAATVFQNDALLVLLLLTPFYFHFSLDKAFIISIIIFFCILN